jgi:hypothetical protein
MKKYLIILSFLMTALVASSQKDSTINVSRRFVSNALRAKDSLDIMVKERDSLLSIKSFYETLNKKDSTIIATGDQLLVSKDKEIRILEKIQDNLTRQTVDYGLIVQGLKGEIKNKNRTIRKITIAGITVSGTLLFFLIKK